MARTRTFASLSPRYQKDILRAGITPEQYESGAVSLQKARYHVETPEHPERADASKHPKYVANRAKLVNDIQRAKRELFESSGKFNNANSKRAITVHAETGRVRTKQQLQEILKIAEGLKNGTLSWTQFKGSPDWDEYRHAFFYH
jgi:hypothetical protein